MVNMKKNILFMALIAIIVLGIGYFMFSGGSSPTGKIIDDSKEVQIVKLSVENGKYILDPPEIKKGVPVRIEADMSKMPGCSKSIVIASFNIRKTLNSKDNTIEFTPDKAGTFNIACSMNMYRGTFVILEDNGLKPTYVEQNIQGGSTCGMATGGSGGCGCGG